jgi:hypothetical protein
MRNVLKYRLLRDIVIPAGTVLDRAANERGGTRYVECVVPHGKDFTSVLVVQVHPDAIASGDFQDATANGETDASAR